MNPFGLKLKMKKVKYVVLYIYRHPIIMTNLTIFFNYLEDSLTNLIMENKEIMQKL